MLTIRAMTGGAGYAQKHLEHSDYFDQNRTVQGEWHGRGAELLGLNGAVTHQQFEAVREGLHPETGEFLRPRHSADRLATDGEVESKARSLYDLTFSAPKSVSVQALVGGDDRLLEAHRHAVDVALQEAERYAGARVRLDGANHDRQTGNLVVAAYTHDSSRQLDPQLHTHAVAANLSYDGVEGRWKALQASGMYERRAYITEVYRNELAKEVRGLGYEIESQRNAKGVDNGFEIKGISKQVLEKYSQRSDQRDESIRQFAAEHGRKPTDNEVAVLVRESRPDKLHEISSAEVHRLQLERISPLEHRNLLDLREQSIGRSQTFIPEIAPAVQSLQHAEEHLFERKTVSKDHELMTEALRHGRGKLDLGDLRGSYEFEVLQGKLLQVGGNVATQTSLERERSMVAVVDHGIHRYPALGGNDHFEPKASLRLEQRHAVETILASQDFAVNLRGAAGTGKTATLQEIDRGLHAAGHEVLAVAPTRSAVEELQKVGFGSSMTISRLLEDQTAQERLRGNVLIVDEAGMVSGRQMEGLLDLAHREDARILFSGDTRQIQSVESSDALRILERESRMTSVSLTGIQRQSNPEYREAIETFRQSPDQGFAKLQDLGALREVPYTERAKAVADVYREMTAEPGRKVLVVAPTHEEIGRVTQAIREDLKQRSVLGDGETLQRHIPLQWTEAQKKDISNYQPDQVLVFHRASHGIEKHEALTVTGVSGSSIHTMNERGEEKSVSLTQARSFSVHERTEIEIAAGDKLLMMGNRKEPGFRATNGELTTVRSVERGIINLEDGRSVPANYREFTHGYAVTAHRSQGKTVDQVIISADVMKQELFYVAASRGREGIAIVTSDVERLGQSLGVSMARPSAIELANEISQSKQPLEHSAEMNPKQVTETLKPPRDLGFEQGIGLGF
jgi:conjugative relaxase-like TrwC/TraI family protein